MGIRYGWRGFVVVCALALTAAACGDDDDDGAAGTAADVATTVAAPDTAGGAETTEGGTESTEGAGTTDGVETTDGGPATGGGGSPEFDADNPLGELNPADDSMEPLQVGYVWSGVSPSVDNSLDEVSADATVEWINEYGGGIAGHPLELVKCATNSDAAVAATCGSEMLEAGVPLVMLNVVGEIEPWATPVMEAGIPIFAFSSADASLLVPDSTAFTMSNPISGIGLFPAVLADELGASKSAVIVIDVPGATGPAQAFGPASFEELDAGEVTVVPISPTAPDHGPTIQVALQDDPEVVHIIGNPAFCSLSVRALRDAGYEGTISMISNCLDEAAIEQLGSDLEGIYVTYAAGEDPQNPDYQRFKAIIEEFAAEDIAPSGTAVGSFVVLEGFRRVMEGYTGELTSEALLAQIRGAEAKPQPTIEGQTFKCDGTAIEAIPIACTSAAAYSVLDASGAPTTFTGYSG